MPLVILQILGSIVGMIATWFIGKKVSAFATSFLQAWNAKKEADFKAALEKKKLDDQAIAEKQKKAIDDFLNSP